MEHLRLIAANLCFVSGQPPDTLVNALVGVIQSPDMLHISFFGIVRSHSDQQLSVTMIEKTFQTELPLTIYCFTITITLGETLSQAPNKARVYL